MSSWKCDPDTGDYITEQGKPVIDESIKMPAYFRMKIKRNDWLYAPNQAYGSDFHLIKKRPVIGQSSALTSIGERALKPLLDDGRANSVTVLINQEVLQKRSNVVLDVNIVDSNQKEQDLQLPAILGG